MKKLADYLLSVVVVFVTLSVGIVLVHLLLSFIVWEMVPISIGWAFIRVLVLVSAVLAAPVLSKDF